MMAVCPACQTAPMKIYTTAPLEDPRRARTLYKDQPQVLQALQAALEKAP